MAMNAIISSVVRTQSSNTATASKLESETIKSAEEVTGGQNTAVETSVSSKYDTLDLSRDYLEYKTQSENSSLQDQTSQLNTTIVQFPVNTRSAEIVNNIQLYAYTEIELLDMVNHATISREAYMAEIASRAPSNTVI
jgi:hypothetical protein